MDKATRRARQTVHGGRWKRNGLVYRRWPGERRRWWDCRKRIWSSKANDGSLDIGQPALHVIETAVYFGFDEVDFAVECADCIDDSVDLLLVHDERVVAWIV